MTDNLTEFVMTHDTEFVMADKHKEFVMPEKDPGFVCDGLTVEDGEVVMMVDLGVGGYFSMTVATVGVLANILAISVFCRKVFKSNFNHLLIALACFDLLFLTLSVTESVRRNFELREGNMNDGWQGWATHVHHLLFPHFLYPLHNILLTCSIFMTVSISIERYLAIFRPLVYKHRSSSWNLSCHIIPVILLAITINLPKFFESQVTYVDDDCTITAIELTELRYNADYTAYYIHWTRFLVLGFLPMVFLLFLNLRVFTAISRRKSVKNEASYSTILLLIVQIFLVCHLPRLVLNLYETIEQNKILYCGPPFWALILDTVSNTLLTLNSALNFLIYFLAGSKFRQTLFGLFSCKEVATTNNRHGKDAPLWPWTSFSGQAGQGVIRHPGGLL